MLNQTPNANPEMVERRPSKLIPYSRLPPPKSASQSVYSDAALADATQTEVVPKVIPKVVRTRAKPKRAWNFKPMIWTFAIVTICFWRGDETVTLMICTLSLVGHIVLFLYEALLLLVMCVCMVLFGKVIEN
ncbi:hypothetical protein FS749_011399 [Ceratobasidium sp. UAMH 11750]|nr:hypothetical protein FS749_011399 [Ceratobasidium sp. UAMH 11750]